ncbi:hypothetical protein GQR58_014407 [Nymphon striatum]|nr:hypothetical protein GQR58_014407 [Nymphon striatum]
MALPFQFEPEFTEDENTDRLYDSEKDEENNRGDGNPKFLLEQYLYKNDVSPDKLLHDISSVLTHRKNLCNEAQKLESEVQTLENVVVSREKALPEQLFNEEAVHQRPSLESKVMPQSSPFIQERITSIIQSAMNQEAPKKDFSAKSKGEFESTDSDKFSSNGKKIESKIKCHLSSTSFNRRNSQEESKKPIQDIKLSQIASESSNGDSYSPISRSSSPSSIEDEKLTKQKTLYEAKFVEHENEFTKQVKKQLSEKSNELTAKQEFASRDQKSSINLIENNGNESSDKSSQSPLILKLGNLLQSTSSPKHDHELSSKVKKSKRKRSSPYHNYSAVKKQNIDETVETSVITTAAPSDEFQSTIANTSVAESIISSSSSMNQKDCKDIEEMSEDSKFSNENDSSCPNYLPRKNWQNKIVSNSSFDKLSPISLNQSEKSKEKIRKNLDTSHKPSSVEKTWVVDTVKHSDGSSSNIKENTLSMKFKLVPTSPETGDYKIPDTEVVDSDNMNTIKKGPKTPPDTPPRTPTPSSNESPLRPLTPQMTASPRDSPLIRTTRSRSRSNDSRCSQNSQSPSPAPPLPPPSPTVTTTVNVYQGKFRPKGKNWQIPPSATSLPQIPEQNSTMLNVMNSLDSDLSSGNHGVIDHSRSHHLFSASSHSYSPSAAIATSMSLPMSDVSIPSSNVTQNLPHQNNPLVSFRTNNLANISQQSLMASNLSPSVSMQQIQSNMTYYRENLNDSIQQPNVNNSDHQKNRPHVNNPQGYSSSKKFHGIIDGNDYPEYRVSRVKDLELDMVFEDEEWSSSDDGEFS